VCAIQTLTNGHIEPHSRGLYKATETAQVLCDPGQEPENPLTTCTSSRLWDPVPKCIPIICNSLPQDIQHGRYDTGGRTSPFSFNHTILPVCNKGYYLQTHMVLTCISTDIWSGNHPVCEIIKCFRPTVQNGLFTPTRNFYDYNTQIKIQCNMNFEIEDGPDSRTCQEDGTWGSDTLHCVKSLCNDTRDVMHASIGTFPQLAIGEIGSVWYNYTVFLLQSGSVEINCSMDRKLSWISTPEFGRFLNVLMDVLINVPNNLYERHKQYYNKSN